MENSITSTNVFTLHSRFIIYIVSWYLEPRFHQSFNNYSNKRRAKI